ncbi:MAG: thiamine-phosphate kinase [Candidatus Acetothermia bacterium]
MDEKEALNWLYDRFPVGDDCFILPVDNRNLLLTIDMLHQETDFPSGLSDYAAGWRSVAVSLSDIAAMGGKPLSLLMAYGAPRFDKEKLESFLSGSRDLCQSFNIDLNGGDLDHHSELTVVTAAVGEATTPVRRSGANPGELVGVTGKLGRTGAALAYFNQGNNKDGDRLFRFEPRIEEGQRLAEFATSMIDVSDGLARSLHQLAEINDVGFQIEYERIPLLDELDQVADTAEEKRKLGLYTGEDFELLFTAPAEAKFQIARGGGTVIGEVTKGEVLLQFGNQVSELEDRGYVH